MISEKWPVNQNKEFDMKTLMTFKVLCSVALLALLPFSSLANSSYKPASFGFDADELSGIVNASGQSEASLGKQSSLTVYCQVDVDTMGKASQANCFEKYGSNELETQTENALNTLSFQPAEVDGEAVPVRVVLRVVYSGDTNDQLKAILLPNLGTMQGHYGHHYIAPQERLDTVSWYQRYGDNSWIDGALFFNKGPISRVAATVKKNGKPTFVRTLEADGRYKRDANVVKSALKRSKFIPGFVDNKAVPMVYLAILNYE